MSKNIKNKLNNLKSILKPKQLKGNLKGLCQEFCPEIESLNRKLTNDIFLPYENKKMIKKYNEDIKNNKEFQPEEFRTLNTLENCFNYLITIYFKDNQSIKCYEFINNRIKSIILDISLQEFNCLKTAYLLKKIIRFYLLLKYNYFKTEIFDDKELLNIIFLAKSIYFNYNPYYNIELLKYSILLNIQKKSINKYYYLRNIKEFELIFQIYEAFHTDNANDFFYAFSRLSFFNACSVLNSIYIFRLKIINIYNEVFKNTLVEPNIINERLLIYSNEEIFLKKELNSNFFSFNLIEENSFKKHIPLNLKRIFPKNILKEINTPDLNLQKYINQDLDILNDLKNKLLFNKIYKYLKIWKEKSSP